MNIIKLRHETDRRLHRIIAASDPAVIDGRYSSFLRWAHTPDRYAVVATHLSESIWAVARVLPDNAADLIDMGEDMPSPARIAFDVLLETLTADDDGCFVTALLAAFTEHRDTDDLLDGLTLLAAGMAMRLGSWVWQN